MRTRRPLVVTGLAVGVAAFAAVVAAQQPAENQPWVHVQIEGGEGENANANINLPLSALQAVLSMAPETVVSDGRVMLGGDHGLSVTSLRETWHQLRTAGNMEFITLEQADQTVRVARVDDLIEVRIDGDGGDVRADLPVTVVDALLSGEGEALNIAAAVEALQDIRGDIVRVDDGTQQIRVWIDEIPEQ